MKLVSRKSGELLDEALAIYFKAPASFTGEDVVEFHTHGGEAASSAIIDEYSIMRQEINGEAK